MINKVRITLSKSIFGFIFLINLSGCTNIREHSSKDAYSRHVGDIEYDALTDDSTFNRCHPEKYTAQYFNFANGFRYKGEKRELIDLFQSQYEPVKRKGQDGYIRIRFVVNCEGQSGQFRVLESDKNFEPHKFHFKVVNQLLEITKSLDGWLVVSDEPNGPRDYYQYLIFKINDGKIEDLMP